MHDGSDAGTGSIDAAAAELTAARRRAERALGEGDYASLERACRQILGAAPNDPDAVFLLGIAAAGMGRWTDAAARIARAVAARPRRADYRAQLARCLIVLRREAEALQTADEALALKPADALTLDTIGVALSHLGAHARAAPLFARAVEAEPGNTAYLLNLASALRYVGDFAGARKALEDVIRLAPRHYGAHAALADLETQTPERNHIPRLLRLLDGVDGDVDGELRVRQALAKEHEDIGEYAEAFRHLAIGRARKRTALGYRFEQDRALFDSVERACGPAFFARPVRGAASDAPIFVLGMPRTGTTLVARILASHSDVVSAGELQTFGVCVKRAAGTRSRRVLDPATIEAAAAVDVHGVGERYLESVRPMLPAGARRFVDKLPLNFFYVGFIHRALPHAKIVCLKREPLDTCLANFRQLFAVDFAYYRYAYDLADIADYYVRFHALMAHWNRMLPGVVLELDYERLVANQESETRRLLDFCGLEWQAACLAFHRNEAPVATASAVQVREPLNSRSIGRWRRYAAELADVRERLAAAGIPVSKLD
jgi:tetratricopeptide (TPR) repeat protein